MRYYKGDFSIGSIIIGLVVLLFYLFFYFPIIMLSIIILVIIYLINRHKNYEVDEYIPNQNISSNNLPEFKVEPVVEEDIVAESGWDKIFLEDISSFNEHKLTKKDFIMSYIDENGYERNYRKGLIHRVIAYKYIYNNDYKNKFSTYQVHHKDGNKRNNLPSNLQILTKEQHKKIHGIL